MWSIYGAERTQPATVGHKSESFENGSNKPNPLRSIADSCAHNEMVRRVSTVRVRQRASAFSLL